MMAGDTGDIDDITRMWAMLAKGMYWCSICKCWHTGFGEGTWSTEGLRDKLAKVMIKL